MKSPRGCFLPPFLSLQFPQYFHPTVEATSPHLSPLLLGKHAVSAPQVPGPQAVTPVVLLLLLLPGQGGVVCYAWCVCVLLVQKWGGEVFAETEGPGLWAGASGYLHFLVSFRPLCPAEILHSTSYPTLSLTHTYKHTHVHTKCRHLQTQKGY